MKIKSLSIILYTQSKSCHR